MTSKPTARELVEKIKKSSDYNEVTIPLAHLHQEFLLRVIKAAVYVIEQEWDERAWEKIDQRLAEGEK